jgi:intein-encoded DNA endonuclease-like protein
VPLRKPIYTIVGRPIDVQQVANPTKEQIDELHEKYINELIKTFNENKAKYLDNKETTLQIV